MTSMISKDTALSISIDTQMYLCRSFNYKKTNNTSTHLPSNAKHKYEPIHYSTTCTTRRSALTLVNCQIFDAHTISLEFFKLDPHMHAIYELLDL